MPPTCCCLHSIELKIPLLVEKNNVFFVTESLLISDKVKYLTFEGLETIRNLFKIGLSLKYLKKIILANFTYIFQIVFS